MDRIDYTWVKEQVTFSEYLYRMYHTDRISITRTRHGEYRVWDNKLIEQVGIFRTLAQAKRKAEIYYQIHC